MKRCQECLKEFVPRFDYWTLCYGCYRQEQNGRSVKVCAGCGELFKTNQDNWMLCHSCYLDERMERSGRPWRHPRLKWLGWLFG